jgi:hypothetical protein
MRVRQARREEEQKASGRRLESGNIAHAESASHPSAGIFRLQRTIGNQAVQRLMVQRQPTGGETKPKEGKRAPTTVATMSLANGDKLSEMKLQSFQFVGKTRSAGESKGEEAPKIEVAFAKESDNSSVALHKAAISGEMIATAQFDFTRRGDDGTVEIVHTFEFVKGYVTSFSTSGAGDRPIDFVSVQFEGSA